ncbi:hypothetical protein ABEB36_013356 [Hypothenemus hampei]|uniref:NADH dehydrogenase [ubiquinone] 1 beta subcomplex subunit 8, mitochondrial n=1 Tax=Hypothenemus hampei TaxID=57062 RepID=A0ABD1E7R0_HYPHA
MNSLVKTSKISILRNKSVIPFLTAVRSHWNKDFKPGPYPITEEQRIAAAKKYGIPIEEYEPYPDNGSGSGDYPKFRPESGESRDPFYPWDNPELKRNFGETLHSDFDMYTEDRYDINRKLRYPLWVMWLQFLGVIGGFAFLHWWTYQFRMFLAATPRQYPTDGKVHYTFEKP